MIKADIAARERTIDEISCLGLDTNLRDLEVQGYTVVNGVLTNDQIEKAKDAILRRVKKKTGGSIDPESASADDFRGMEYQPYLIFDDPVFPEILLEPKTLALVTYLLGESCVLSSMGSHFRGPGGMPLPLHADGGVPGMNEVSQVANCNYALTEYSEESGALIMVPGSHRMNRQPSMSENWRSNNRSLAEVTAQISDPEELATLDWQAPKGGVTLNLEPGDAVIWHGNTWHGGWRRDVPGLRMNLAAYFCRPHMATQELRGDDRYPEVFAKYTDRPRFAQLLGKHVFNGWREEGPDMTGSRATPRGLFD